MTTVELHDSETRTFGTTYLLEGGDDAESRYCIRISQSLRKELGKEKSKPRCECLLAIRLGEKATSSQPGSVPLYCKPSLVVWIARSVWRRIYRSLKSARPGILERKSRSED